MITRTPVAEVETQVERLLTKYDSLTRPDLLLELRVYDPEVVSDAIVTMVREQRIRQTEDINGVKVYKRPSDPVQRSRQTFRSSPQTEVDLNAPAGPRC